MERTDLEIYKELAAKYLKERNQFEELSRTARLEADGYFNIIEQAQKDSEKTSGLVEELVKACDVVHHRLCNQQTIMPKEYRKFVDALARAKAGAKKGVE